MKHMVAVIMLKMNLKMKLRKVTVIITSEGIKYLRNKFNKSSAKRIP